jgi:Protein of unknown function
MSEEETAEIVQYLVEAAFQLDEARAAAALLSERDSDAAAVRELTRRLNSELLNAIFARFSNYLTFEEFPEISSCLRWDQVRLPPDVSETRLDEIVMSAILGRWQKMAMVIWNMTERAEGLGLAVTPEMFAARVQALVEMGRLDSQGDLRRWRHSEVRLKRGGAPAGEIGFLN